MHELSLAQGLLGQVVNIAEEKRASKVNKVKVSIGAFSGVVVDSFIFGFEALKREHPLTKEAELEIESPAPVLYCAECNKEISAPASWPRQAAKCPQCQNARLFPCGGDELLLLQIEME